MPLIYSNLDFKGIVNIYIQKHFTCYYVIMYGSWPSDIEVAKVT